LKYLKPLAAITFWGASFVATKIVLIELHPLTLIFLRFLIGMSLLGIIGLSTKTDFSIKKDVHTVILIMAVVASFHMAIQVTGMQYTSASNTGWIIGTTPIFMALIGWAFLKEKLGFIKIAGIVISFAGLILLITRGNFAEFDFISNKGDFMVLVSAFTWSVYSYFNKKVPSHYPSLMTIFYLFAMVALFISPFAINQESINAVTHLKPATWGAVLFLGLFCSGIAYVLWSQTMQEMSSAKAGVFLYIEPFVTVITASIIINEQITPLLIISGVIIIAGVVLVNWNPKSAAKVKV